MKLIHNLMRRIFYKALIGDNMIYLIEIPEDLLDEMLDSGYDYIYTNRGKLLFTCIPIGFMSLHKH